MPGHGHYYIHCLLTATDLLYVTVLWSVVGILTSGYPKHLQKQHGVILIVNKQTEQAIYVFSFVYFFLYLFNRCTVDALILNALFYECLAPH